MILKLSKSLAEKVRSHELGKADMEVGPYQEWCGRVFRVRNKEFILTTEVYTLFSVIIEGRGINDLEKYLNLLMSTLQSILKNYGISDIFEKVYASLQRNVYVFKAVDKSLLATMNDLSYQAKWKIQERGFNIYEAAKSINEMPALSRNAALPIELFGKIKVPFK